MATLTPEINLKSIIEESREIAQALCEFADNLEEIEKKYKGEEMGKPAKMAVESEVKNEEGSLSWLGKRCEDCGNKKCKELVELPKGYDCALWQPKVENYSIKTVTNAKEAENYPISEDISKGIEAINKLIFENGQAGSEERK